MTFQPVARPTIYPMRRRSPSSVLMTLLLTASVFACAAGWCGQAGTSDDCTDARKPCFPKKAETITASQIPCGALLKAAPGQCGMRGFVQLPFEAREAFENSAPLRTASSIAPPLDSRIIVSSIGSSQTDRGPPVS